MRPTAAPVPFFNESESKGAGREPAERNKEVVKEEKIKAKRKLKRSSRKTVFNFSFLWRIR